MRVVQIEDRVVDARGLRDAVTGVTFADDMGSLAVSALLAQAEGASRLEVGTFVIDFFQVVHGKLVADDE